MKKLFVIIFLIILPVCSFASEKPVWTQATGEAYLGEIDTPKEVKGRAKIDAQKNALEQAVGVFIKSHTLVSNSQLAEDLVYASVRGQIERTEILHEGWDKQKRSLYRVTVRTLIKPVYPEKGKGLFLKAYISKTGLKEGEEVRIFYEASSDCYVYIFSVCRGRFGNPAVAELDSPGESDEGRESLRISHVRKRNPPESHVPPRLQGKSCGRTDQTDRHQRKEGDSITRFS